MRNFKEIQLNSFNIKGFKLNFNKRYLQRIRQYLLKKKKCSVL